MADNSEDMADSVVKIFVVAAVLVIGLGGYAVWRFDQIWLPVAFAALIVVIAAIALCRFTLLGAEADSESRISQKNSPRGQR